MPCAKRRNKTQNSSSFTHGRAAAIFAILFAQNNASAASREMQCADDDAHRLASPACVLLRRRAFACVFASKLKAPRRQTYPEERSRRRIVKNTIESGSKNAQEHSTEPSRFLLCAQNSKNSNIVPLMITMSTKLLSSIAAASSWAPRLATRVSIGKTVAASGSQQRSLATLAFPQKLWMGRRNHHRLAWKTAAGLAMLGAAQYSFGEGTNVFEHKFTTTKKPEDLSDFYGTEDFMEIFSIFPFVVHLMMRGAEFDDEGTIHTHGLLGSGELEVSIDFSEEEIDTTGDGKPDTIAWFNKREHFEDSSKLLGGMKLWEMTQNFGYHRLDNGTCEVYHHGEYFKGLFPVRLIFQLHAKYVIWATERFINSDAFGSEDEEVEAEVIRQNIPAFAFKEFLTGLTRSVEKAKSETPLADVEKRKELDTTLQRLSTLRRDMESNKSAAPIRRIRTEVRSTSGVLNKHHTTRIHVEVEDKEARDTLRRAMEQISQQEGGSARPVQEIRRLTRRVTTMSMENQRGNQKK